MKYFITSISDPSQRLPQFVSVGYVDGQAFIYYDSNSRRREPRVSWMEKVGKQDPQYWDRETQKARGSEEAFRGNLETLRLRYNQSEGFHIIQWMYGCELQADGRKGGFMQHGYDGRTFLTFDKERLTWVALQPQAQITQRKWDVIPGLNQRDKAYLEEICIEWLEKYLSYGKETLLRTEPPEVTMSSKTEDGMETHVCRLDGFYPREIEASWTRDGEVWLQDTLRGSVAPNADGTFHTTLSIRIDPKERGRYRCHVEHDSLPKSLDVALEEPKSNLGIIIGCVVAGLVLLGVIVVGIWFFKRRQDDYKKAATSEKGSNIQGGEGKLSLWDSGRGGSPESAWWSLAPFGGERALNSLRLNGEERDRSSSEDPDKAETHSVSFSPMQTRPLSSPLAASPADLPQNGHLVLARWGQQQRRLFPQIHLCLRLRAEWLVSGPHPGALWETGAQGPSGALLAPLQEGSFSCL
ncbi:class I histocompatibility antigen Gogo-OKO alpha chain-like [Crotalus adamanteus]|uniref:Class I histocompatibility antigen Gogo-OKO alpha chain-like n=1 Tax=Crotalus adamanteus TaxID=8729 RepID=A0AAW1BTY2_CROAD